MIKDMRQLGARFGNPGKSKGQLHVDAEVIRELSDLLVETGLTEIELEQGGRRIRVARQNAPHISAAPVALPALSESVATPSPVATEAVPAKRDADGAITSPMVGTVYVAPEPGKPPFVKVGDTVREGDTLLIVEAMKTMNPISAPRAGTIREICVRDAQPVEFGQMLLVLS
ncbi:MAG TPA: acetyl-CoA carboxylase biotin carboxyl carrier protein [Rhizomicrobium sp.]|jgi:acetyl-CoA carboxylase biotin carboxyl carrier protein|nr:acetyl-CoA carboxylase biotin carboxyl carrier protein [Rhizomicrobium sp.]